MSKFGFWIEPESELQDELRMVVEKYSRELGTPGFELHMTIHGVAEGTEENVMEIVSGVVGRLRQFELQLGAVEFSTTYFQCVFVRVRTSAELMNLHLVLREGLEGDQKHVFMPHVSLVYGDLDMETREKISGEIAIKRESFQARRVTVVRADSKDPKDWLVVGRVDLS